MIEQKYILKKSHLVDKSDSQSCPCYSTIAVHNSLTHCNHVLSSRQNASSNWYVFLFAKCVKSLTKLVPQANAQYTSISLLLTDYFFSSNSRLIKLLDLHIKLRLVDKEKKCTNTNKYEKPNDEWPAFFAVCYCQNKNVANISVRPAN